jgi:hypothetical protein
MAGFHSKTERGVKQEIFAHFVLVTLKRLFANRAYGRGERTILDTSVRRVWQIAAGKIRIAGKSWPANFANILSSVAAGLGCDGASIRAEGDR